MIRKLAATTTLTLLMLATILAGTATADPLNDPDYWVTYFEGASHCVKHETPSDTPHGYETEAGVILNPIQPEWGAAWVGLVIKAGTERTIVADPVAGVEYPSPEGREVSHWIVCKAAEPPPTTTTTSTTAAPTTTTTLPPTTTSTSTTTQPPVTTTTTEPPTTTTVTTVPPSTTSTTTSPPINSTLPPTTSTTSTTSPTSGPPTINIDIWCEWDNRDKDTGAHEPIISMWDYTDPEPFLEWRFAYVVYDRAGTLLGVNEFGLTTPTRHDSWVSDENTPVPIDGFTVTFLINGEIDRVLDDPACMADPPATTTTTIPDPPTGVPTGNGGHLPNTGAPLEILALIAGVLGVIGGGLLLMSRDVSDQ